MFKLRMSVGVVCLSSTITACVAYPQEVAKAKPAAPPASLQHDYGKLPLSFEANQGQVDNQVRFISRGNGYSLFLTDREAVLALTKTDSSKPYLAGSGNPGQLPAVGKSAPSFDETIRSLKQDRSKAAGQNAAQAADAPMKAQTVDVVRMELAGALSGVRVDGDERLPGVANYFIGNDPAKWHANVPTYAKVKYMGVYPGVDLVYYGNQRQLEYDFVVAPGADPKRVKLHFAGAEKLKLTPEGDLEIVAKNGEIAFHKPVVYQAGASQQVSESAGQQERVKGKFVLLAGNTVGFEVGSYDKSRDLVIDPTLAYSTYLGGSGYHIPAGPDCCGDSGNAIAVDAEGNAYVTGSTGSADFPVTSGAFQSKNNAPGIDEFTPSNVGNAFVTKLNPTGTALIYSTYLGGSGSIHSSKPDAGLGITVDSSGNAYITGATSSTDFPITTGAYQKTNFEASSFATTAFVTKLNSTGSGLIYSTFLGGSGVGNCCGDQGQAIALDSEDHALVVGTTYSKGTYPNGFPITVGAYQQQNNASAINGSSIFLSKLNQAGSELIYSTYLGGSGYNEGCCYFFSSGDVGSGLAVDGAGSAYVTGHAWSKDFPVTANAYQKTNNADSSLNNTGASNYNAFVTKFNPTGTALVYSTYLGGSGNPYYGDVGSAIAVDSFCSAYVAGYAGSSNFPTTSGVLQPADLLAAADSQVAGFVTKFNADGTALEYSTYLSGTGGGRGFVGDRVTGIALDANGHAFVTGTAQSQNGFPTTNNAYQATNPEAANPGADYYPGAPFVTVLNAAGTELHYSSFLGGSSYTDGSAGDFATGIALDLSGNPYITGNTFSSNFPVLPNPGAYQLTNHAIAAGNPGSTNAFVAKFAVGYGAKTEPTTTSVTSDANPSGADSKVTFTAFVQPNGACAFPPTGKVSFSIDGGAAILVTLDDTGHAAYATSTLTPGKHTIDASYSGDMKDAASTASLTETIQTIATTTTTLTSSPNPSAVGQSVTFKATVAASSGGVPTGTVTFVYGGGTIGTATLSGGMASVSTSALTVGKHSVTATYNGSSTDAASASSPLTQTINPTTTTTLTSSPNPSVVGQSVTFKATVAASSGGVPTGTVTFVYGGGTIGTSTLTGGVATISTSALTVGKHTVTATYNGSSTDAASTSAGLTQAVNASAETKSGQIQPAVKTIPQPPPPPTFSPAPGTYAAAQAVIINHAYGATVYYTTNGATPTTASARYTGAFAVSKTETLKAIAVLPNDPAYSAVASGVYTIQ